MWPSLSALIVLEQLIYERSNTVMSSQILANLNSSNWRMQAGINGPKPVGSGPGPDKHKNETRKCPYLESDLVQINFWNSRADSDGSVRGFLVSGGPQWMIENFENERFLFFLWKKGEFVVELKHSLFFCGNWTFFCQNHVTTVVDSHSIWSKCLNSH